MKDALNPEIKRRPLETIAICISLFAIIYPFLAIAIAQGHYAITSKNLNQRMEAGLFLLAIPICLYCALSLILSFRADGKKKKAGIIYSCLGIALNILFLLAVGASD
jgi:hypothetical protein